MAALGEHALGVELHALDGQGAMAQPHDDRDALRARAIRLGVRAVTSSSRGSDSSATISEW